MATHNKTQHLALFFLRSAMGWMFLYAGITKILNPHWSAAGYIQGAKHFTSFYHYFLQPGILSSINILNEWGLFFIGVALILGVWMRVTSFFAVFLMILYYVALPFPHQSATAYIVDEHVVYIFTLLVLSGFDAGKYWGLGNRFS